MENTGSLLVVALALVDSDCRVLVQQRGNDRSYPGLWEFPGGKVEPGETPEVALIREIEEELAITVPVSCLSPAAFASEPHDGKHLILLLYVARKWTGTPRALAASALKWVRPNEMYGLEMPSADRPLIAVLDALI